MLHLLSFLNYGLVVKIELILDDKKTKISISWDLENNNFALQINLYCKLLKSELIWTLRTVVEDEDGEKLRCKDD